MGYRRRIKALSLERGKEEGEGGPGENIFERKR